MQAEVVDFVKHPLLAEVMDFVDSMGAAGIGTIISKLFPGPRPCGIVTCINPPGVCTCRGIPPFIPCGTVTLIFCIFLRRTELKEG